MTPEEIDERVRRAQEGDKKAFTELFLALHQELRIFISAHAASVDMVEEVLQAAFVTCYRSLRKYDPRGTFLSWLKGIARNHLHKELAELGRVVAVEGRALEQKVVRTALRSLEGEPDSGRSLDQCIDQLPPHARDLIHRRYADQHSIREIARDVRKSESWVAVTLFRLREALRRCLAGNEPVYDR